MKSLPAAVTLFLDRNLCLADINPIAWAATFGATVEQLKAEIERQQTIRSTMPSNSFDEGGEK